MKSKKISAGKLSDEVIMNLMAQYHTQLLHEVKTAESLLSFKRIYDAGQVLELAFKRFFLRILPSYVGITRGVVIDCKCEKHSDEIDLIFYDRRYFSGIPIRDQGDDTLSWVPVDVVLGVAQVKKTINLQEFKKATNNLTSVLALQRTPITNQTHFDMPLAEGYSLNDNADMNKLFTCILSAKNLLLYKTHSGKKTPRTREEVIAYFNKHPQFFVTPIDLLYTIDGSMFVPMEIEKNMIYKKTTNHLCLGEAKFYRGSSNDIPSGSYLYEVDMRLESHDKPEQLLGQLIVFISYWCKSLVKTTPDLSILLNDQLKSNYS